ncbi:MAG: hypothetical protein U9R32_08355 [Bacteroidota bacterium]|nr:hypothetical protein [Bacteroidota bacterium]
MLKYVVVLILMICVLRSYSQIEFQVKELNISNVRSNIDESIIIDEDEQDGPYLNFECMLINKSKEKVILYPAISELYLTFSYNRNSYSTECFALQFQDNDSLIIEPEGIIVFLVGTNIFLGTPMWDENKKNYSKELIEILPTLKLEYKEDDLTLRTNKIINAKIID